MVYWIYNVAASLLGSYGDVPLGPVEEAGTGIFFDFLIGLSKIASRLVFVATVLIPLLIVITLWMRTKTLEPDAL